MNFEEIKFCDTNNNLLQDGELFKYIKMLAEDKRDEGVVIGIERTELMQFFDACKGNAIVECVELDENKVATAQPKNNCLVIAVGNKNVELNEMHSLLESISTTYAQNSIFTLIVDGAMPHKSKVYIIYS